MLEACRELEVTLIAYSPLAMGALTGVYSNGVKPRGLQRFASPYFLCQGVLAVQPVVKLLSQIGERYGKTPSQVALRRLIENPLVLPIPGAKNGQQASQNAAADAFSLTQEEIEALDRATLAWDR